MKTKEGLPDWQWNEVTEALQRCDRMFGKACDSFHALADSLGRLGVPGPALWRDAVKSIQRRARTVDAAASRLLKRVGDPD